MGKVADQGQNLQLSHAKALRLTGGVLLRELACKPGSVQNDHLSSSAVADRVKPPPEDGRAGHLSSYHGVAPDRVYSVDMSPCDGWALTPPFHHPPPEGRESISVALVRGLPLAGVTRYPCPVEPGLSSRTAFRLVPAVVRPAHRRLFYSFYPAKSTNILVIGAEKGYNKIDRQKGFRRLRQQHMVSEACGRIII